MFGISRKVKFIVMSLVAIWLGLMLGDIGFDTLFGSSFTFRTHGTVVGLSLTLVGLLIDVYFGKKHEVE